ncbi:HET-domain-containing protein [Biscogniauxia marginata]|nr:HET-domain-containing protein [Biscogniauxia marginata]
METFKGQSPHRPLIDDETEIRIINLLPNQFNAPIECELEHVSLEAASNYEAVSYVWGDASITETITLDGRSYPITVNLYTGLQYLRLEDSPRRLWVDSLCINQGDMVERSHEILKMRKIYALAKDVLVWLGDYKPYTRSHVKRLFDYVAKLANASFDDDDQAAIIASIGYDELWHMQVQLSDFMNDRRWFERMWVIQEVAVRPRPWIRYLESTPDLICGHLHLPFAYLRAVHRWWSTPSLQSRLGLPVICPSLGILGAIWEGHRDIIEQPYFSLASLAGKLAWVLTSVATTFNATDPRDIVYAALELTATDELPGLLRPDYTKSQQQVLIDCATFIFNSGGLINIIGYNSMQTKNLPSWVPDWRHCSPFAMKVDDVAFPGVVLNVLERSMALEADILTLSTVKFTGPNLQLTTSEKDIVDTWREFFIDARDLLEHISRESQSLRRLIQELWQLVLAFECNGRMYKDVGWHVIASKDQAPFLDFRKGAFMYDDSNRAESLNALFLDLWERVAAFAADKYIFGCSDGSIGIMSQPFIKPQPNDLICSIKGAYSEFILRNHKDGYQIVGRCERTKYCFNCAMCDIDFEDWLKENCLYSTFEAMWDAYEFQKVRIY